MSDDRHTMQSLRRSAFFCAALAVSSTVYGVAEAAPNITPTDIDYGISATALAQHCRTQLHLIEGRFDAIALQSVHGASFDNVVRRLEGAQADANDTLVADLLLGSVSSDRLTRDASNLCQTETDHMFNRVESRPELATLLYAVAKSRTAKAPADGKLLELWQSAVKRTGATLSPADHRIYLSLNRRLDDLQNAYIANLSNNIPTITLTTAQTLGLPTDFLRGATVNENHTYTFSVDESTDERFLRNARDESARRAFYSVFANRGYPENEPILEEALNLRLRIAHLLGYPDWASYVLADRMAKTPQRVHLFLDALDEALLPTARREVSRLERLKAADLHQKTATISRWDTLYYDEQLRRSVYAVDSNAVRRYFPVDHVIATVLSIYARMLGISFAPVVPAHAWSSDVQEFAVSNAVDQHFIGTLYLDLYPRPGKYTHFASFPLLPVRLGSDGKIRPPIDAIIGNWSKPIAGETATLSHEEVQTFFHEFGHAMATLLATAPYESLSEGFRTDFVEAPSQMLENFVWQPSILKALSSDADGLPLPDDLIDNLIAARHVDDALFNTQQILFADVDLAFHSQNLTTEPAKRWQQLARLTTPIVPPDFVHPEASFSHIMGGYDAGYYGYLWSRVYAQDMFTAFEDGGVESPVVGARYRATILEPARTLEPDVEVRAFLGRPVSPQAFYRDLGIRNSASSPP